MLHIETGKISTTPFSINWSVDSCYQLLKMGPKTSNKKSGALTHNHTVKSFLQILRRDLPAGLVGPRSSVQYLSFGLFWVPNHETSWIIMNHHETSWIYIGLKVFWCLFDACLYYVICTSHGLLNSQITQHQMFWVLGASASITMIDVIWMI